MKIKVFLLTADELYAGKLYNAFLREYPNGIELILFDSVEVMQDQVRKLYPDIVLVDEALYDVKLSLPGSTYLALLGETKDVEAISGNPVIGKYQRISDIYSQLLEIYSKKQESLSISLKEGSSGQTKILTFLSPAGGTGASTMAAACARQLALKGESVIYLNLEQFGRADAFFTGTGNYDFDRVIYALALDDFTTSTKMENALRKDESGVRFYSACKNCIDMQGILGTEGLENLFDNMKKMKGVGWIVVDCDCSLSEMIYRQIERSYLTIVVSDGTEDANTKTERYLKALEILAEQRKKILPGRICVMYNRFGSRRGKNIDNPIFRDIGRFGRVKNAGSKEIIELMNETDMFNPIMHEL